MKRKNLLFGCLALAGILNFSNVVNAQNFKTSPLFQAGMVLQYGMEVPIWGTADAGAKVKAEWNGIESSEAVADENGKWKVVFPSTNYGGPYEMNFSVNGEVAKPTKMCTSARCSIVRDNRIWNLRFVNVMITRLLRRLRLTIPFVR